VSDLTQKLKVTQTDLTSQLMRSEEALSHRTKELEKLKSDWSAHTSSLTNENAALLTSAKEKAIQVSKTIIFLYLISIRNCLNYKKNM
jgi:spindle assembly abnormal protein 6